MKALFIGVTAAFTISEEVVKMAELIGLTDCESQAWQYGGVRADYAYREDLYSFLKKMEIDQKAIFNQIFAPRSRFTSGSFSQRPGGPMTLEEADFSSESQFV